MKRTITIYRPGGSFPSFSATGSRCDLMCDHCRGHYLGSMRDVSAPGSLLSASLDLWKAGGSGFLLSGGSDPSGRVAYPPHILPELREVKERTGLVVNVHPGIVSAEEAHALKEAGSDLFSFDLVLDESVLKDVMHLDVSPEDVLLSFDALRSTGARVVPHILAGLGGPELSSEKEAVHAIKGSGLDMAVLILHIPTKGTPLWGSTPPEKEAVLELSRLMVSELKGTSLSLGCMRSRGDADLEISILRYGFSGIVQPSRAALNWVEEQGFDIVHVDGCCAAYPPTYRI